VHAAVGLDAVVAAEVDLGVLVEADLRRRGRERGGEASASRERRDGQTRVVILKR
jgi:hypothetical protein